MNTPIRSASFRRTSLAAATLALLLSFGAGNARAGEWSWTLTPYTWLTDIGIDAQLGGRQVVDETIPVRDLIEDIDLLFQGRVEAQNGAHGVMLDVFYAGLSDEERGVVLPQGAGEADLDWQMDMTIVDMAGTYDPTGDRLGIAFLYGARIIDQRSTVDATYRTTSGAVVVDRYETSETLVDALAGVRFARRLSQRLFFQTQADLSTGGTDVTWSLFPSLSYAVGKRQAITAGYRTMAIDFENHSGLESDVTLSGLVLGFRMKF